MDADYPTKGVNIPRRSTTKGLVRKLNALRKSLGDDLAEEVFARWLEREAALQARSKPDPVAMKIVEALAGFEWPAPNVCANRYVSPGTVIGKG